MAAVRQNRKMQAGASSSESIITSNHLSEKWNNNTGTFLVYAYTEGKAESGYIVDSIRQKGSQVAYREGCSGLACTP